MVKGGDEMRRDLIVHARTTHVALATLVRYAEMQGQVPKSKAAVISHVVELAAEWVKSKIDVEFTTSSAREYLDKVLPKAGVVLPRNLYQNLLEEDLVEERRSDEEIERAVREALFKNRRK